MRVSFPEVKQPGPEPDHSPPHVMLRFDLPHDFMVYTETLLSLSLMKQQFVTTHTIPQTMIPAKQLGYKHTFCQNVVSTKQLCLPTFS